MNFVMEEEEKKEGEKKKKEKEKKKHIPLLPKTGVELSLLTGVDDRELDREERLAFVSGPAWNGGEGWSGCFCVS